LVVHGAFREGQIHPNTPAPFNDAVSRKRHPRSPTRYLVTLFAISDVTTSIYKNLRSYLRKRNPRKTWLDGRDDSHHHQASRSAPSCGRSTRSTARLWAGITCGTRTKRSRPGPCSVACLVLDGTWRCSDTTGSRTTLWTTGGLRNPGKTPGTGQSAEEKM
jgi:hypothetical protein